MQQKAYVFEPTGNDLKKVLYYYGLDIDEKIVCPFHDDNHPSCHIDFDNGVFHCFACGASGDALKFVQLGNPQISGLNQLILYFNILKSKKVKKLKIDKRAVEKRQKEVVSKQDELDIAHDFYYGLRPTEWAKEHNEVKRYMMQRGFTSKTLNKAGAKLTITSDIYPIIFPIYDLDQFKGYVCRTNNKRVEQHRKYLYNKGFSRNDTLGGNYKSEVVMLCEGFLDKLKLNQFGINNVAAIFGWKITSKQIDKLKANGVKTIISALDMDAPGRKGTDYLKNFFEVIEFQFPKGVKDPGQMNYEQFKKAYNKTKAIYRRNRNVNTR